MATSGTNVFENSFPIDEVFEEAYERVGLRDVTGYHLTSARRSLNIMLQEWANRGLHYWELAETNIDLVDNLLSKSSFGIPDWEKIFSEFGEESNQKVFYSGPNKFSKDLKKACKKSKYQFKQGSF